MEPKGQDKITLRLPFHGFGTGSFCDEAHTETVRSVVYDDCGTAYADLESKLWSLDYDMSKWCVFYAVEYADSLMQTVLETDSNLWTDLCAKEGGAEKLIIVEQNYSHYIEVAVTRDIAAKIRRKAGRYKGGSHWKEAVSNAFHHPHEFPPDKLCDFEPEWQEVMVRVALSEAMGHLFESMDEYYLMEHASGNGYYDNWLEETIAEKDKKAFRTLCRIASRRRDRTQGGVFKSAGVIALPDFALPLLRHLPADPKQVSALLDAHPLTRGGCRFADIDRLVSVAAMGGLRAAACLKALCYMSDFGDINPVDFIKMNLRSVAVCGLGILRVAERALYGA